MRGPVLPWYSMSNPLIRYFRRQVDEIASDRALRWYGVALALVHVLTVEYWIRSNAILDIERGAEAICWPLVPSCSQLRVVGPYGLHLLLVVSSVAALGVSLCFLVRRITVLGYWGLVGLTLFKLAVLTLDFRLRLNEHYMAFAAVGVFLLVPGKRSALRGLIVLFYFWSGTLKLNYEWISGSDLHGPLWLFHGKGIVIACVYVIVLELLISWGLLARRNWIFWGALAQFLVFHLFSWPVVGFFYPLLMFLILSIYPILRLTDAAEVGERSGMLARLWHGRERWPTYATMAAFSLLQVVPWAYPGDTALTGEGRVYALHMFDAKASCNAYAVIRAVDGSSRRMDLKMALAVRIVCDPIVYFNRARNLCRARDAGTIAFADLDLHLDSRHATDSVLTPVIAVDGFCARHLHYDPFRHNDWILTARPPG